MSRLRAMESPHVEDVRGAGLLVGVEIKRDSGPARAFCEALMAQGVLAKETHAQVIRFAPPLNIDPMDLDWAMSRVEDVLS